MLKLLIVLATLFAGQSTTYNPELYGMKDGTKEVQPANPWYPPVPIPPPPKVVEPVIPMPKPKDKNPYSVYAGFVIALLTVSTLVFRRYILAEAARRERELIEKEQQEDVEESPKIDSGVVEPEGSAAGGNDCKPSEVKGGEQGINQPT